MTRTAFLGGVGTRSLSGPLVMVDAGLVGVSVFAEVFVHRRLLFGGIARLYGFDMLRRDVDGARDCALYDERAWVCGIGRDIVSILFQ